MKEALGYRIPALDMARENMFWLRIFRDHSQFLMETLTPAQTGLIAQAQQFYQVFERLQAKAGDCSGPFLQEACHVVLQFRSFQLGIVNLQLTGGIPINLPPGALNEMLDEEDEYLRIVNTGQRGSGMNEAAFLIHQQLLWLPNFAAHAALVRAQLDPGEANLFVVYNHYAKIFQDMANKTMELRGLMRDNLQLVPALAQATRESGEITQEFIGALEKYRENRSTARVLAISPPLLADHFIREAGYYQAEIGFSGK